MGICVSGLDSTLPWADLEPSRLHLESNTRLPLAHGVPNISWYFLEKLCASELYYRQDILQGSYILDNVIKFHNLPELMWSVEFFEKLIISAHL